MYHTRFAKQTPSITSPSSWSQVCCPPASFHLFLHRLTPEVVCLSAAAMPHPTVISGDTFSDS